MLLIRHLELSDILNLDDHHSDRKVKTIACGNVKSFSFFRNCCANFPKPLDLALIVSPVQWLSAIFSFLLSPIVGYSRLQTSSATTPEHVTALINKYRVTNYYVNDHCILLNK